MSHLFHPLKPYKFNRPIMQVYGKVKFQPIDPELCPSENRITIINHVFEPDAPDWDKGDTENERRPWEMVLYHPRDNTINHQAWDALEKDKIYRFSFTPRVEIIDNEELKVSGWFIDAEDIE